MIGKLKLGVLLGSLVLVAVVAAALVPHSSYTGPQEDPPAAPEPDRPPAVQAEPVPAVEPAPPDEPHLPGPPDRPTGYAREQHGWYAMDVPAGWTLQYLVPTLDGVDLSQVEVLGGAVSHTYVDPLSLYGVVSTSMDVMAAPTPLTLEEYVAFETDVVLTVGELFGMDNQLLGSSPAMLGSRPGLMTEYRLDLGPAESFTMGTVTALVGGVAYSVSYAAADETYQDGRRHLVRAAESFEAIPAGLPGYMAAAAGVGSPGQAQPVPPVSAKPGIAVGVVTGVVDGDTIDISGARHRLSLVDTPERGEPGFAEATSEVERLCPAGSAVYYDGDDVTPFDRYGRHLGVVWCEGNGYTVTVGEHLWRVGLAEFYYEFCNTAEAAAAQWAAVHGWFYYGMCHG